MRLTVPRVANRTRIIVHEGEWATSGHYKALVKAGGGAGSWFCVDDRTVTEVSANPVGL